MNKVAKGTRKEKACEDELKAQGYITWKTIRHKYLNIDLFGLFDVVALHPEGKHLLFIQVKSNRIDNKVRQEIKELKMPSACQKWIWCWMDKYGWRKELIE